MTTPGWDPGPGGSGSGGWPGGSGPGQPPSAYGMTPAEQAAYQLGRPDLLAQARRPRMTAFRIICGILWAAITTIFTVGLIVNLGGHGSAADIILDAVIAVLAGWYDYRIWTRKARRLFLII